jgi:hypothetical protein
MLLMHSLSSDTRVIYAYTRGVFHWTDSSAIANILNDPYDPIEFIKS